MTRWGAARTVVEEPDAQKAIDKATASDDYSRFDDAWEAAKWLLARKGATLGRTQIKDGVEYRLYKVAGDDVAKTPDIAVVYTVTEDEVMVVAVKVSQPEPAQE